MDKQVIENKIAMDKKGDLNAEIEEFLPCPVPYVGRHFEYWTSADCLYRTFK